MVDGFFAAGGGTTGGVEAYVDFTPFVVEAETALREAIAGLLPDPTGLLGLDRGTWLFATADVHPGTHVEVNARLHVPEGTLAARLADSFEPLPLTLPPDVPRGTRILYALDWNLSRFYATARAGFEQAEGGDLMVVDQGLAAAEAMSGVDPVEDVIDQLAGLFAVYHVVGEGESPATVEEGLGLLVGLVDGQRFLEAFEAALGAGQLDVDPVELEGAETYLLGPDGLWSGDADQLQGVDGGLSVLPTRLLASLSRRTLVRGLRALGRVEGAGLEWGSGLQAALDQNAGACAFAFAELSHLRALADWDEQIPSFEKDDPFDSEIVFAAERVADGFEARLYAR